MPLTLQDLYAQPRFIEKVEQLITAEIMSRKFPTLNPDAVDPMKATPIAVSLDKVEFSNEDEERIQGEVIVSARLAAHANIALASKLRTAGGVEETTQDISQDFRGSMNFSLPWSWQARTIEFVLESVQIALTDLRTA
jgi:hypothetical protein